MKIVAISGSPRYGNTYSALKTMMEKKTGIDFRIISLGERKLEMCRGCYVCIKNGEDKCPLKDDRDEILQAITEADGLILASPIYSHMISAQMKNFFERLGFLAHRPRFFGKFAMAVTTCSGYGAAEATGYMEKMLKVFGFSLAPALELKCTPGNKSPEAAESNRKKALDAFDLLAIKINKGERDKPSLNMLIPFGVFKYVSEIGKKQMPADYDYYKNKDDYYYDVKIPFHQKMIAQKVLKKITAGFSR